MTTTCRRLDLFRILIAVVALTAGPVSVLAADAPAKAGQKAEKKIERKAVEEKAAKKGDASSEMASDLPPSQITVGGRVGDSVAEGFGDILVPVFLLDSGLFFVNPRATLNDNDAEEYNIGAGYRHLIPQRNFILGANIYYDYRETERNSDFGQVGFGAEFLSDWVDARFNYYLPDDEQETVAEQDVVTVNKRYSEQTTWQDPVASGNTIVQEGTVTKSVTTTTIKQHLVQYEQAMEGFDTEVGVKLPIPLVQDYADVRVFGGYYKYNASFGASDVEGLKGRLEIRAMPSLFFDAEWFEDSELWGSDYYIGARVSMPFDVGNLARGRNPFEGAAEGMKLQKRQIPFAARLTEMVMRDPHIQTEISDLTEELEKRETTVQTQTVGRENKSETLASDVIFVNGDSGSDANPGTYEQPLQNIETGVSNGLNVFVMATIVPYNVNLLIDKDVNLMGQGYPIGVNGEYLNGDSRYAVIQGDAGMPTIMIDGAAGANTVQIRGFQIGTQPEKITYTFNPTAGIWAMDVPSLEVANNLFDNTMVGLGALYSDVPTFQLWAHNNTFDRNGIGAVVVAVDSKGSLLFEKNDIRSTAVGVLAVGLGLGSTTLAPDPDSIPTDLSSVIRDNTLSGGGLATVGGFLADTNLIFIGLPDEILETLASIPVGAPSLLGIGVVGLNLNEGALLSMNTEISGNRIEDNIIGIAAAAVGSNAVMDLNISNNELIGGGSQAVIDFLNEEIGPFEWPVPIDISGVGIAVVGAADATINNLKIENNTISDHALGVLALGYEGAVINNGRIANNEVSDSWAGIALVNIDSQMNDWQVTGNTISGSGLGALATDIQANISTNGAPDWGLALLQVQVPDVGIAGIVSYADGDDAQMNNLVISGNKVDNALVGIMDIGTDDAVMNGHVITLNEVSSTLMGIGVFGIDEALMKNYEIGGNVIDDSLAGVLVAAVAHADMSGLYIHDNTITGGGIADLQSMFSPFFTTNIIGEPSDLAFLTAPMANDGVLGVGVVNVGATINNMSIYNNAIADNWIGVGVLGAGGASMIAPVVANNTIDNSLIGVGVIDVASAYMPLLSVRNNTINDTVLGIAGVSDTDGNLRYATIANNTVNGGMVGVLMSADDGADMRNLTISGNAVTGGRDEAKLDLFTLAFSSDFIDYSGELDEALGVVWDPATLPASGLVGVNVSLFDDAKMSCTLANNTLGSHAVGMNVLLDDNMHKPSISINNNVSDAPYTVHGTNYVLTQSGNVPSPVIEIP